MDAAKWSGVGVPFDDRTWKVVASILEDKFPLSFQVHSARTGDVTSYDFFSHGERERNVLGAYSTLMYIGIFRGEEFLE